MALEAPGTQLLTHAVPDASVRPYTPDARVEEVCRILLRHTALRRPHLADLRATAQHRIQNAIQVGEHRDVIVQGKQSRVLHQVPCL
eukprot:scaffold84647_cov63-Phaeocystis_antarctica.AAC.3